MTSPRFLHDLLSLFYPDLCMACGENLPPGKEIICLACEFKLPRTNFHLEKENPFTERFWGRIPVESGAALYHFLKGGRAQRIIHNLKYKGKREVGVRLGQYYGHQLRISPYFRDIDMIVPAPLHPKKERRRGFNQAAVIARGLAEAMRKPWNPQALIRTEYTATQTQKSRIERFENVMNAFEVKNRDVIEGKHILLVDDVMTTGATLEACALKILENPGTKVSMATIGIAQM
jgi:ComF family protein